MALVEDIRAFHEKFGLSYDGPPRTLEEEMQEFRIEFLVEELDEYVDATDRGDLEGMFDALVDLVYVALGTAYLHGFPFREGWDEVQRANMTKVRATRPEQSKRDTSFDVVKPKGWTPPDMAGVLRRNGG